MLPSLLSTGTIPCSSARSAGPCEVALFALNASAWPTDLANLSVPGYGGTHVDIQGFADFIMSAPPPPPPGVMVMLYNVSMCWPFDQPPSAIVKTHPTFSASGWQYALPWDQECGKSNAPCEDCSFRAGPPQKFVSMDCIHKNSACQWGQACLPDTLTTGILACADECPASRQPDFVAACTSCLEDSQPSVGPWFVPEANGGKGACCPGDPTCLGVVERSVETPPPFASWISSKDQCACGTAPGQQELLAVEAA